MVFFRHAQAFSLLLDVTGWVIEPSQDGVFSRQGYKPVEAGPLMHPDQKFDGCIRGYSHAVKATRIPLAEERRTAVHKDFYARDVSAQV